MKRIIYSILGLIVVGGSVWLGIYFYNKSKTTPTVYKTEKPFVTSITKKTIATGSIVPLKEVNIKPQVSGIVEELFVEAGQTVKSGQPIAKIKIVPNLANINQAENTLEQAKIQLNEAKKEFDRFQQLYDQKVVAEQEYRRYLSDYNLKKQAVDAAANQLHILKSGSSLRKSEISNIIYSTISGMLLDVPVKVGTSVIERNNFNEGTTIATVADMKSLIFEGEVDEAEVAKLKEGMELAMTIGAIEDKKYQANLYYISPKGVTKEGAIKFQIKARVVLPENEFIRAGYSANADIVLDKKDQVLAIKESLLQFKKDSVFVEVETAPQKFEKRIVKTGISDGINIEVVSGVKKEDKIKVSETAASNG
ncbi:efflux RND transporter periplasmic adaptor subunit [Cytophagaceae bacterium DM2B3-1]|uniref:Efflux RND transporter periplasmic adaptor subunit n=1 Tax=Xanthocytophaga flava TaxID=3048013 RepID=A0ABT7CEF9_9BACT|nr:efflux RND transporter periplasmic adaptor subunit [Xanthocytophaga flavus]MDJ1468919.1 efflux RND transporter periplasmic adaptor subunit [Xanthocytophaga flavus]MDJ1492093.1 efflux RND transporter periplasmic adaptor subunit [Xanthocytophaga flavus]